MSTVAETTENAASGSGRTLRYVGAIGIRRVSAALMGRFTVLKQLAKSADAEFYLARPASQQGSLVRIKVLSPRAACDYRKRELFRLEAGAAASLEHSGIVRSSKAVELDGIHLCVIEHRPWVEPLSDLLKRKGWLDFDHAARIIDQVASAVGYAHEAGVLHLRLAPESILIEPNAHVLVSDFGISSRGELAWAHHERSHGAAARYLSIEQMLDRPVDHRTDVYSLGLLLYEMLTDRCPFDSHDVDYLKRNRLAQAPTPPSELSTGVDESVSKIVMAMLERDPANRPGSVGELRESLRTLLSSKAEAAMPPADRLARGATL